MSRMKWFRQAAVAGALLLGALAERVGAAPAVWLSCSVYLAGIAFVAVRQPVIRDLNGQTLGGLR